MKWLHTLKKVIKKNDKKQSRTKITVIWIHGANQSSNSFNFLSEKCNFENEIFVNYDSSNSFYENLDLIHGQVSTIKNCFLIGHSMGGVYALHLLRKLNVAGAVTISTPFNGSRTADWAKFVVPKYQLFRDVGKRSEPIVSGHKIDITCPWTQIVTTAGGVPYHEGPNDGVCTTASMEHRKHDMDIVRVATSHFEVMVCPEVKEIIDQTYNRVCTKFNNGFSSDQIR